MKVLVACEMTGRIRESFIKKGHEAYSCDLMDSEIPSEYHIKDDVLNHLDEGWDLMIGHPVCTFMCRNRARQNKIEGVEIDTSFFMSLLNADIPKICIENPVPSLAAGLPKYTQIIQPYHYGHDHSKKTCLWLKNLPKLEPTNIIPITYTTTQVALLLVWGQLEASTIINHSNCCLVIGSVSLMMSYNSVILWPLEHLLYPV